MLLAILLRFVQLIDLFNHNSVIASSIPSLEISLHRSNDFEKFELTELNEASKCVMFIEFELKIVQKSFLLHMSIYRIHSIIYLLRTIKI